MKYSCGVPLLPTVWAYYLRSAPFFAFRAYRSETGTFSHKTSGNVMFFWNFVGKRAVSVLYNFLNVVKYKRKSSRRTAFCSWPDNRSIRIACKRF